MKIIHAVTVRHGETTVAVSTAERGPDALNNLCAEACRAFGRVYVIAQTEFVDEASEDQAVADMTPPVELDEMPPLDG